MFLMQNSHNSFSVFQVQLWGRKESGVTETAVGELLMWQSAAVRTGLGQSGQGAELDFMAYHLY